MTAKAAQRLDRTLTAYRIGDPSGEFPIFDAAGSRLFPGRWNTPDTQVIYASEHYSTALLEKLVHGSGVLPPNQHFVGITVDAGVSYEVFPANAHQDWAAADCRTARRYGAAWVQEGRSAILLVPSVVARVDRNVLINPAHPDMAQVRAGLHEPVWWDDRLFSR